MAGLAGAQGAGRRAAGDSARAAIAADEQLRISPAYGLHYGLPLRYSAAVGVIVDRGRSDGLVATVEPGLRGTEISAGYFHSLGLLGSGFSLRAAVIRTREEPWNASARTTYAGVEFNTMILFGVGGRVGYFRRVSGSSDATPIADLVSVGLSIGA